MGILPVFAMSALGDQQPSASPKEAPAVVRREKVAVTCFQLIRNPDTFLRTVVKIPAKRESMGRSARTLATKYSCLANE